MKYYKCENCGFEFARAGKVENCPYCNKKEKLRKQTSDEEKRFLEKHMANRC